METIKNLLISIDVEELSDGNYLLTDCSSGWVDTKVTKEQLKEIKQGKLKLIELEWK